MMVHETATIRIILSLYLLITENPDAIGLFGFMLLIFCQHTLLPVIISEWRRMRRCDDCRAFRTFGERRYCKGDY